MTDGHHTDQVNDGRTYPSLTSATCEASECGHENEHLNIHTHRYRAKRELQEREWVTIYGDEFLQQNGKKLIFSLDFLSSTVFLRGNP